MQSIDLSQRVWQRLLAVREGSACSCCGDWSASEKEALSLYGPIARRDLKPTTVGQVGQSLDGRIATSNGDVGEVSGPDGLVHLHRMRALVDGVVIGVKTALHDSPRLTVRLCEGVNPARIVIDPRARLPNDSPVLRADGARRIVIQAVDAVRPEGVEVVKLNAVAGHIAPEGIVQALRELGLTNLMVEGGSFTLAKFLQAGLLDRLQIAVAPVLIGTGPAGLTLLDESDRMSDAIRPQTTAFMLGSEVIFDCALTANGLSASQPLH
jgi:riboflavin-specific deaminase-like protein